VEELADFAGRQSSADVPLIGTTVRLLHPRERVGRQAVVTRCTAGGAQNVVLPWNFMGNHPAWR